ncbi:sulfite exporter TauE/SafE family protein [Geomonas sp. RF6]|uniref:sulfite exporter TauE/SafE family protein n=1 Tax=Geomonas sp. RF6 TaxID=2897342 RepID=UPI001E2F7773|nr:sulfite exporter TauE/SafE family protein [Geomonas sp. RF6]UFS71522.1 sulfite exporter TauE/SafE family protein [Geomonas sp. RF6]
MSAGEKIILQELAVDTGVAGTGVVEPSARSWNLLWILLPFVAVAVVFRLYSSLDIKATVAGFSTDDMMLIETILFFSGVMSGLSGFGFSAVGAATLLFMSPVLEAPLLQTLSTCNQLLSVKQLRADMPSFGTPEAWKNFWDGPGFCILGGVPGSCLGIWLLSHLPGRQLTTAFGGLLVLYAIYSIFKPAGAKLKGFDGPITGTVVGFIGGALGGFTAFPGAAVVVWTGLRDLPKTQNRAIVQPYIIMSQLFSLALVATLHPEYLSHDYWMLLLASLPAVLPGTLCGLFLYKRISDVNFRRVSFLLLGLSGMALLLKNFGSILTRML